MAYIKLFKASDNSEVSPAGTFTNAIEFTLRADLAEDGEIRLYAEADAGYIVNDTNASIAGTSAAKWALAPDVAEAAGTYGADGVGLTLGTVEAGAGGRVFFWAKAKATVDEEPVNDSSVTIELEGIAGAV